MRAVLFRDTLCRDVQIEGRGAKLESGKKRSPLADFLSLCAQSSLYLNAPRAGVQDGSTSWVIIKMPQQ